MKWKIETVLQTSPSSLYAGVVLCITSIYIESSIRQCYNFCFQSYFNKLKGREIAYWKHPDIYHFCCSFPNFQVSLQYYFPSFLRAVFSNSFQCRSTGKKFSQFSLSGKSDMSSFMSVSERYFCCIQNSGFEVVLFFPFST